MLRNSDLTLYDLQKFHRKVKKKYSICVSYLKNVLFLNVPNKKLDSLTVDKVS